MLKRTLGSLAAAVLVLSSAAWAQTESPGKEPVADGRKLSEWVADLKALAPQTRNAAAVAAFLAAHPKVEVVHYPGLETDPGHEVARRQMAAYGGMVSFEMRGGAEPALAVTGRVRLFIRATSLGGAESLIEHRASVEGPDTRSPPGLLRLSVGLEHADDLVADLDQALA